MYQTTNSNESVNEVAENPWAEYFGDAPSPIFQQPANAMTKYARHDLPVAYLGKNYFLNDVLVRRIVKESQKAFTTSILPLTMTDQMNIVFNTWRFTPQVAGRVPHTGVSRLLESSKDQTSAVLERRGIGFVVEHGFMQTEEGKRHYLQNIKEIVDSVNLTLSYDALSALLHCKRANIEWRRRHGYYDGPLAEAMKSEVDMFGILQKNPRGFDILVETARSHLSDYGVTNADALILPSKVRMYAPMVPDEKVAHYNRGDLGVEQFEAGPLTTFRGIKVYESHDYVGVEEGEMPVNLMSSTVQIGQHNVMSCSDTLNPESHQSSHRDIMIFDASKDNFTRVNFMEAIRNSYRFGSTGELSDDHDRINTRGGRDPDLFQFKKEAGNRYYDVAEVFSQMHKDSLRDYLPKSLIKKVGMSALKDLDSATRQALTRGVEIIDQLQAATSTAGSAVPNYSELKYTAGDAGFGQTWFSLRAVAESETDIAPAVRSFMTAFSKFREYLLQRFPESLTLKNIPEEWSETVFGAKSVSQKDAADAAFYTNIFTKNFDRVAFAETTPINSAYVPIGTKHECNVESLEGAQRVDAALYKDALSKYEVGSEMYNKIVHGVSDLLVQHKDDLTTPQFDASYGMLSKIRGASHSSDTKVLKKMGVTTTVPAESQISSTSWKVSPLAWGPWFEGKPGVKKVSVEALSGVDAGAGQWQKSFLCAALNNGEAGVEAAVPASVAEEDFPVFSVKSKKAATIGADINEKVIDSKFYQRFNDQNTKDRFEWVQTIADGPLRIAIVAFLMSKISMQTFESMHVNDVLIPVDILLARPYMSFEAFHAILCKSGRETGATFVGHSDFQLQDDAQSKRHFGHFTFMAKPVVRQPQNVCLMKNVFINRYVGGWNTKFFSEEQAAEDKNSPFFAERSRPSIIAMMVPAGSSIEENPLDIRKSFSYYESKLNFASHSDPKFAEEYFEPREVETGNPVLYRGAQKNFDVTTGRFSEVVAGSGHLGQNIYPGVMSVLNGSAVQMKEVNFS